MANEGRRYHRNPNDRKKNDYGRKTAQQRNESGNTINNARPDQDDIQQDPFYLDEEQIGPFWQVLSDNLNGKTRNITDRSSHVNPNSGHAWVKDNSNHERNAVNPYDDNKGMRKLQRLDNGSYVILNGSNMDNHGGDYQPIPKNSLNIMDYAEFRGFTYKRQRNEKGIEYRLQWGNGGSHSGDFDSTYVALNPQPFYEGHGKNLRRAVARDEKGNIIKNDDGSPKEVRVTGKGAFVRFSKSDLGQGSGGDNLIRFIMEVNGYTSTLAAYKELNRTIKAYGPNTRFNTADPDAPIPENSEGRDYTYVHHGTEKVHRDRKKVNINRNRVVTNPYEKAVAAGHNILMNSQMGQKALEKFHKAGYSDKAINDSMFGWLPGKEDPGANILTHLFQSKDSQLQGMGINSNLTAIDPKGNAYDRFGGMYIAARKRKGKIVGLKGYKINKNNQFVKVQDVRNTKVVNYDSNYGAPTPYGFNKNGPNSEWDDKGAKFNHKNNKDYKKFAIGYLRNKRGISASMSEYLWDQDLIRVSMGIPGKKSAQDKLKKAAQFIDMTKKYGNDAMKKKYGAQALNRNRVKCNMVYHSKKLRRAANGYPAYVEFAHKLVDGKNQDLKPGKQETVGADRILFDHDKRDSYVPYKDGMGLKMPKSIGFNSMHNYGFNFSAGHRKDNKERRLYVFESPLDAISYADTHRDEIRNSHEPCDFLSLGGSGAKTKVINNYIHHKTDDTGERYNKIIFGTDNDPQGQNVPIHYTERDRIQMPKDRLDSLFKVVTAPYGKDWNATSQHYAFNRKDEPAQKIKTHYDLSEFMPKAVRDNIKGMSEYGREQLRDAMKHSNKLYTQYINRGSRMGTKFDEKDNKVIRRAKSNMKDHDDKNQTHDRKIYDDLMNNIGRTMKPREILAGIAAEASADNDGRRLERARVRVSTNDNQETEHHETTENPDTRTAPVHGQSASGQEVSPTSSHSTDNKHAFEYKTKVFSDEDMGNEKPSESNENTRSEKVGSTKENVNNKTSDTKPVVSQSTNEKYVKDPLDGVTNEDLDKGKTKAEKQVAARKLKNENMKKSSPKKSESLDNDHESPSKEEKPKGSASDDNKNDDQSDDKKHRKHKHNHHFGGPKMS